MNPHEYVADLHRLLQANPHVATYSLKTDHRGTSFLYLHGKVDFLHGATLDFKEFLDFHANPIEKYMYAYNYRVNQSVIFRYDNTPDPRAKHLPTYPSHKHQGHTLVASPAVDLPFVVDEILQHAADNL